MELLQPLTYLAKLSSSYNITYIFPTTFFAEFWWIFMGLNLHEIEGHAAKDQKQIHTSSMWINHTGSNMYQSTWSVTVC